MTGGSRERLQKVLAAAGIGSRRACEVYIADGRVTVNGEVAELGQRVDPTRDEVRLDGERVSVDPTRHYLMLNKPAGVVTTADDPEGRPTVMDLINVPERLFPVGRLDQDTEGLLLLTNDGDLAHALTHPSFEVERVYLAMVRGPVRKRVLQTLRAGVELEDGPARPRRVRLVEEDRGRALLEVVMTEGRKREVRRLLAAVGLPVEHLARVGFGGVELGELRQGKWRPLTSREIASLYRSIDPSTHRQDDSSTKRSTDRTSPPARRRSDRDERAARAARPARTARPAKGTSGPSRQGES